MKWTYLTEIRRQSAAYLMYYVCSNFLERNRVKILLVYYYKKYYFICYKFVWCCNVTITIDSSYFEVQFSLVVLKYIFIVRTYFHLYYFKVGKKCLPCRVEQHARIRPRVLIKQLELKSTLVSIFILLWI